MGSLTIDMTLSLGVVISSLILIGGWYIAHASNSNRDHRNKKREIRIQYLINSYRDIGAAAGRQPNSNQFQNLESAFHDVQLFGSPEQLIFLNEIFISHARSGGFDVEPLLNSLRRELRELLDLKQANESLKFFRAQ